MCVPQMEIQYPLWEMLADLTERNMQACAFKEFLKIPKREWQSPRRVVPEVTRLRPHLIILLIVIACSTIVPEINAQSQTGSNPIDDFFNEIVCLFKSLFGQGCSSAIVGPTVGSVSGTVVGCQSVTSQYTTTISPL
jgi:hypothetical protein